MPDRKVDYLNPEGACPPHGLYSHVGKVHSGPLAFIAGQLAVDACGNIVGIYDFDAQFAQVFENLGAVLKGLGASFDDVVKFTTYLVESQDIEISSEPEMLLIAGVRRLPAIAQGAVIQRLEIPQGRFERRIGLPAARWELNRSTFVNGCLLLSLTKHV